jgi:choice-of-anchor A domain-containing protein
MNSTALRIAALLAPLGAMAATPAHAGTVSVSDIFNQFNAVVFGNFSSKADVEGRTVVGGNLIGGASFDINPASIAASSFSGLTVYGSATVSGNYNVNNGGGVTIAGSNTVSFNLNGGGSAYVGGDNSGKLSLSNGSGSLTIGGANSGTLQIGQGGSVFVGAANSGAITANGSNATVAVNGSNSATINMNGRGSVSVNGNNSGNISLNGGGSFTYTGKQTGNLTLNGGAKATRAASLNLTAPANTLPSFASTFELPLTNLSAQLDTLAANSIASTTNNAVTFNAKPDSTGTAVFDIDSAELKPNSTVTIKLDGATSVIINVVVDGCVSSNCVFSLPNSLNFANPADYASSVLWNFVNATGLTFPNEIGGSVLAPLAVVTDNAPIDGTLVADSYSGNGELHSHPYTGTLPDGTTTPVVSAISMSSANSLPVPEPASLMTLGFGLAALGAARRQAFAFARRR